MVGFRVVLGDVGMGDIFGAEEVIALAFRRGESYYVFQLSRRFLHDE
jgi:hypothetical protein